MFGFRVCFWGCLFWVFGFVFWVRLGLGVWLGLAGFGGFGGSFFFGVFRGLGLLGDECSLILRKIS